jgi:pilus assembly protein CpaB
MQRGRLLIIVALILVVLSIGGIFLVLQLMGGGGQPAGDTTPVAPVVEVTPTPAEVVDIIRAVQPVERGAPIPTEAIGVVPWPKQYAPEDLVITSAEDVVNRRARYSLQPGEPIFKTMIVQSLQEISPFGSDAAGRIPPGFTALSLPYDKRNGVALGIRDGDYVNVIVSWSLVDIDLDFQSVLPNLAAAVAPPNSNFSTDQSTTNLQGVLTGIVVGRGPQTSAVGRAETDPVLNIPLYLVPQEQQRSRLVSQSIIQNAMVLKIGEFGAEAPVVIVPTPVPPPTPEGATPPPAPSPTPTPLPPDIITLVVSPQDALVLDYVNRLMERYPHAVRITYALRSAGDISLAETQSVTLQYMFEKYAISLPAKLPYGLDTAPLQPTPTPAP